VQLPVQNLLRAAAGLIADRHVEIAVPGGTVNATDTSSCHEFLSAASIYVSIAG